MLLLMTLYFMRFKLNIIYLVSINEFYLLNIASLKLNKNSSYFSSYFEKYFPCVAFKVFLINSTELSYFAQYAYLIH